MIPTSFYATAGSGKNEPETIRVATFNVSMDASNYLSENELPTLDSSPVPEILQQGHKQIRGIAEILQRVRPDIVLLNEFDYLDPEVGVNVFQKDCRSIRYSPIKPAPFSTFCGKTCPDVTFLTL